MSTVAVQITYEPIRPWGASVPEGCGAAVEFTGVVRGEENGVQIAALEYEAYPEMAVQEMERLLRVLLIQHPCETVEVVHRVGVVSVGEAAVAVRIQARNRAPAFALLAAFMDQLKESVPIWKVRAVPARDENAL